MSSTNKKTLHVTLTQLGERFSLKFDYDEGLQKTIKLCPRYFFDKDSKEWTLPNTVKDEVLDYLNSRNAEVITNNKENENEAKIEINEDMFNLSFSQRIDSWKQYSQLPGAQYDRVTSKLSFPLTLLSLVKAELKKNKIVFEIIDNKRKMNHEAEKKESSDVDEDNEVPLKKNKTNQLTDNACSSKTLFKSGLKVKNVPVLVEFPCTFTPIKDIKHCNVEDIIDVVGIVIRQSDLQEFKPKQPKLGINGISYEFKLTICDQTNHSINVTIWNKNAMSFKNAEVSMYDIVVFKGTKVSSIDRLSLSIGDSMSFAINPTYIDEHRILTEWKNTKEYNGEQIHLSSVCI